MTYRDEILAGAPASYWSAEAFELQKQQISDALILGELMGDETSLVPVMGGGKTSRYVWPWWHLVAKSEKWLRDLDPRDVLEQPVTQFSTRAPETKSTAAMTPPELWPDLRLVRLGPWFQGSWRAIFFKVPIDVDMAQWVTAKPAPYIAPSVSSAMLQGLQGTTTVANVNFGGAQLRPQNIGAGRVGANLIVDPQTGQIQGEIRTIDQLGKITIIRATSGKIFGPDGRIFDLDRQEYIE